MHIAEIFHPGTWLDFDDKDLSFELEGLLRYLESLVEEAAVSLTMFEASMSNRSDPRREWEAHAQIRKEIDEQVRAEAGEKYYQDHDAYRLEVDRRSLKRRTELGIIPRSYAHRIPFIHAHTFVYAVDSFGKFLDELADYDIVPDAVGDIRDGFNTSLPMVRKIRNSALHVEDRSRRFASLSDKKKGKRMEVDGFLGLSNLEGDHLCYTIDDGSYQRIAINLATLNTITETLNEVLGAMPWRGPPSVNPT